jgi:hypothetical protein
MACEPLSWDLSVDLEGSGHLKKVCNLHKTDFGFLSFVEQCHRTLQTLNRTHSGMNDERFP